MDRELFRQKIEGPASRSNCLQAVSKAPEGYEVAIQETRRGTVANRKLHAVLGQVAEKDRWHGESLSKDQWKAFFTALMDGQKPVPGRDPGTVVFLSARRTSEMSDRRIYEMIEYIFAFEAERGIVIVDITNQEPQGRP